MTFDYERRQMLNSQFLLGRILDVVVELDDTVGKALDGAQSERHVAVSPGDQRNAFANECRDDTFESNFVPISRLTSYVFRPNNVASIDCMNLPYAIKSLGNNLAETGRMCATPHAVTKVTANI
jgi:hypothetical protein